MWTLDAVSLGEHASQLVPRRDAGSARDAGADEDRQSFETKKAVPDEPQSHSGCCIEEPELACECIVIRAS
jgi:hypothetical protein